jgi:hypothetical protein
MGGERDEILKRNLEDAQLPFALRFRFPMVPMADIK